MIIFNLLAAIICGFILGLERKAKQKHIGFKTMVLISVGACIYTYGAMLVPGSDALRVTSQIVTGIGFLGAGVIIKTADDRVSGLTTAAMIWVSASLGILCGLGYNVTAFLLSLLIVLIIVILGIIETKVFYEK